MDPSMKGTQSDSRDSGFDERIVALYPQLFRLAFRLCRNADDAHDLAQDAVERGLRCRLAFRTGDAPDRWMSTILRRMFVDRCRARRRRGAQAAILAADDAVIPAEPEARPVWETFTPDDVQRALLFLDEKSRDIFRLFVFDRLAQGEIAARLSIPRRTVATRVFRIRAKLKKLLESGAHRPHLALVPARPLPADTAAGAGPAGSRMTQHPPRTRVTARRRPRPATAASLV
jgi:RNA polymerase sigma-70 factor (ECF subfamily)